MEVTRDGEPSALSRALRSARGSVRSHLRSSRPRVSGDGERVEVSLGDKTVPATVAPLAIYDPEKKRPRA